MYGNTCKYRVLGMGLLCVGNATVLRFGNGTQCSRAYPIRLEVGVDVSSSLYQQLAGFLVVLVGGVQEGRHAILERRERHYSGTPLRGHP